MIRRTLFKKEIVCEFIVPKKKTNKVIIFATGTPGSPDKKELLSFYAQKGFWVFLPRYRGSWESKGEFLKYEPTKDIQDVIDSLSKGFYDLWSKENFVISNPEVYLCGASFGGPAVLLLSKHPLVKYVFANSPVIDWRVETPDEPVDKMEEYMRTGFAMGYRFKKGAYKRFKKGTFYNPIDQLERIDPEKVTIFHAKDDNLVSIQPLRELQKKVSINVIVIPRGGHFGASTFMKPRWSKYILATIRGTRPKKW